jgi:hypothetical protein
MFGELKHLIAMIKFLSRLLQFSWSLSSKIFNFNEIQILQVLDRTFPGTQIHVSSYLHEVVAAIQ